MRRRRYSMAARSVALSTRCPRSSNGSKEPAATRMAEAGTTGACARVAGERSFIGIPQESRNGSGPISALSYPPDLTRPGSPLLFAPGTVARMGETASAALKSEGPGPGPGGTPGGVQLFNPHISRFRP